MSKLNDDWWYVFRGSFQEKEDVINFIFEHLDIGSFETSYIDVGGHNEPNEMFKQTPEDKKELLYEFCMWLINDQSTSNRWIPVTERLPNESDSIGSFVQGTCKGYCVPIPVEYDKWEEEWKDEYGDKVECIAWQPLPTPYQPKKRINVLY